MKKRKQKLIAGVDGYRITLFKKKLRDAIPEIDRPRFLFSNGKTHLIFEPNRYTQRDEVVEIVTKAWNRHDIDFVVKKNPYGFYSDLPEAEQPIWNIAIPIDQGALPERRRV